MKIGNMQVLMFNSEKGGTGKTTLSTLTAAYLATVGYRVLMLDLDQQAHSTLVLGVDKSPGLYDVCVRNVDIVDRMVMPDPHFYSPNGEPKGRLYLLPGNIETQGITLHISNIRVIAEALADLEGLIDFVVMDTAPSAGMLLALGYEAADHVIIPSEMEDLSIDGLVGSVIASRKAGVNLLGIVPNKVKHASLHEFHYEKLMETARANQWKVFQKIHNRIAWAESVNFGRTIFAITELSMSKARLDAIKFAQSVERELING